MIDNYKRRDLRLVAFAYTFLVLSTISEILLKFFIYINVAPAETVFTYLTPVFGIFIAGILFFLTSWSAHRKMESIEKRTREAIKK